MISIRNLDGLPFVDDGVQAGRTVYVGRGGRTNGAGIGQLRALLAPLGRTVIAVPLGNVLHLKFAVTAQPDGTAGRQSRPRTHPCAVG